MYILHALLKKRQYLWFLALSFDFGFKAASAALFYARKVLKMGKDGKHKKGVPHPWYEIRING